MMTIDFDLVNSADDVSITCTRLKDGGKKWKLILNRKAYLVDRLNFDLEPDDPSMDEDDDHNLDVWCFCDFVDINFWRDNAGDCILFSIYPVDEMTEGADEGSTFTNTNETPVRGIVEFKNEE